MKQWLTKIAAGVLAMCVLASGSVAFAAQAETAQKKGKGQSPTARIEKALAQVNLTAEQKPKVDEIMKATGADLKKAHEGLTTPEDKRKASRPILKGMRDKLNAILTPDQQAKLKELTAPKKKPNK